MYAINTNITQVEACIVSRPSARANSPSSTRASLSTAASGDPASPRRWATSRPASSTGSATSVSSTPPRLARRTTPTGGASPLSARTSPTTWRTLSRVAPATEAPSETKTEFEVKRGPKWTYIFVNGEQVMEVRSHLADQVLATVNFG